MILGIDLGARRIGVAAADTETRLARPVEVIDVTTADPVARISELIRDLGVTGIVVGRPVGLSGRSGPAVSVQQEFLTRLRASTSVEITEQDERFTTVEAERALRKSGAPPAARKKARDAVAAQLLLQAYLDSQP
jgi:putative Holliday junction resolvase